MSKTTFTLEELLTALDVAEKQQGSGSGGGISTLVNFGRAVAGKTPYGFSKYMLGGDASVNLGDILSASVGTSNNFHFDLGFINALARTSESVAAGKFSLVAGGIFSAVNATLGLPGEAEIKIGDTSVFGVGDKVEYSELDEIKLHCDFFSRETLKAKAAPSHFQAAGNSLLGKMKVINVFAHICLALISAIEIVYQILPHFATPKGEFSSGVTVSEESKMGEFNEPHNPDETEEEKEKREEEEKEHIANPDIWTAASMMQILIQLFTAALFGLCNVVSSMVATANKLENITVEPLASTAKELAAQVEATENTQSTICWLVSVPVGVLATSAFLGGLTVGICRKSASIPILTATIAAFLGVQATLGIAYGVANEAQLLADKLEKAAAV